MGAADVGWFADAVGRNDGEAAFLERLRQLSPGWSVAGLSERDTSSLAAMVPLFVDVEVPGLPIPRRMLQVGYWTGGYYERALQGVWGDSYLLDDHDGNDAEDLTVVGVRASHEQHAEWAADWFLRQLRRPVVRQEWLRRDRVVAARWRLDDTGRVLGTRGRDLRRLFGGAPDRVVPVR
ncbi:MAG TPA: hypothetical protein VK453_08925 [Micromonosporaceae bacterium]|nr:hypothetical protein [Micromonosporaceae bacterium]